MTLRTRQVEWRGTPPMQCYVNGEHCGYIVHVGFKEWRAVRWFGERSNERRVTVESRAEAERFIETAVPLPAYIPLVGQR